MDDLRITTPRKATRVIVTKKKSRPHASGAGLFSRVTNFFNFGNKIKSEARLDAGGDGDGPREEDEEAVNEEDEDLDDEERAARKRLESQASGKPTLLDKFAPKSKGKYAAEWDGTGQPPYTEGSVTWSEDRSRAASEVGDNLVDMMMTDPSRIVKEPPVFFDPVEDQVRSRWLAVLAMCAFPTILATILLVDVWDNSTLFTGDDDPTLSLLYRSGDPFVLSKEGEANLSLKVLVTNRYNWPLRDKAVMARITTRELSPAVLRRLPFCRDDMHGTAHARAARQICTFSLRGETVTSDRDGVAIFPELAVVTGLPGAYRLEIFAESARTNVSLWVAVRSRVSALLPVGPAADVAQRAASSSLSFSPSSLPLRLASPPPTVRVVIASPDAAVLNVSDLPVIAIGLRQNRDLGGELAGHATLSSSASQPVPPDPVVVLDGHVVTTATDGVAAFTELAVLGFDSPNLLLAFVCQGEVLVWSEVSPTRDLVAGSTFLGRSALPSVAMTPLAIPPAVHAAASQGGVSVSGTPRTTREGGAFGLQLTVSEALRGVALVGRAVPLDSAVAVAESEAEGYPAGGAGELPRFKVLTAGAVIYTAADAAETFGVLFSFSHFGAVGDYQIELVAMGVVAARVGPINVTTSVGIAMVDMAGSSAVVCGRRRYPVCRHLDGACSFGAVVGSEEDAVLDGGECRGMEALVLYGGGDHLPWVQFVGRDSLTPVLGKQARLVAVPWDWDQVAQGPDSNVTAAAEVIAVSQPGDASGASGAVSFSAVKVLVSPLVSTHMQLAVAYDGLLQPLPIRIRLSNNVESAAARCGGVRACAFIQIHRRIPVNVTAGTEMDPPPAARVVDGTGAPLGDRVVCLAYGSAAEVEAETGGVEGVSAASGALGSEELPGNESIAGVRSRVGGATLGCAVSGADGIAEVRGIRLRGGSAGHGEAWWRFYSPNLMTNSEAGCLAFSGVFAPGCRSPPGVAHVQNPVAWIAVEGGAGAASSRYLGHQAVEVPANDTEGGEVTAVRMEVSCRAADGAATACQEVRARVLQWWNADSGKGPGQCGAGPPEGDAGTRVRVAQHNFSQGGGSGGRDALAVDLNTGLSGIYLLELDSWGATSTVFVVARHASAAVLRQLDDWNAAVDGNYSACTLDCGAKNVSNLARLHPQHIRVAVEDAAGSPVFQAQVHATLVDSEGNPQPGQLAGAVSEPLQYNATVGEHFADFACLALTAAPPGTYRFRLSLHGPDTSAPAPAAILTELFTVKDAVEVAVRQHPPPVVGSAMRESEWTVEADVMPKVTAELRLRRWEGHTAFMYNASCQAPLVQAGLGAVRVSEFASQRLVSGEWAAVEAGAAGRTEVRADANSELTSVAELANGAHWDCWGLSGVATARFDAVLPVAPPGYYCLAVSGEGLQADMESGLAGAGGGEVCSRPFALGVRPVGVYLLSEWEKDKVGIGEPVYAEVQLVGPVGAKLEGHVIEAEVAEDCVLADGSCDAKGGRLELGFGVGVTDTDGKVRMRVAMGAGWPGWYRFRFRCSGVTSLVSEPLHVRGRVATIEIVDELIGVSELEKVPARPLGSYEFGGVQDFVTVPGVHTITGDLSAYLSLQLPKVRVLDEFGSALFYDTEVELHLVTCGRKYMENGTATYPPEGDCVEFIEWEMLSPQFTCSSLRGCDAGTTRFTQLQFSTTTETGFYYVFFAVEGVVKLQEEPIFIRNSLIPADSTITTFRLCILVAVFGMVLIFNANLVYRARFWCQASLLGCGIFFLITILYGNALLNKYGDPSKVPAELVASATLMVLNALGLTVLLTRLVFQNDSANYFTSRQAKYLLALRGLLVSRPAGPSSAPSSAIGRRRAGARVYPTPPGSEGSGQQQTPGSRDGLRRRGTASSDASSSGLAARSMATVVSFFQSSAEKATGRTSAQDVLSGFAYPSRLYQGFGMSTVGVLVLLIFCQSMINSLVFNIERLRAEVVAYRGALGMWKTSTDQTTDLAAVPVPPYSDRIDLSALTFSLMEAIYPDGPALFEGLSRSLVQGSAVGSTAICLSFSWSWLQTFRVYRKKMLAIRADRSLIRHFKFPIHEAAGYIGRQLWASVVSALLVYLPVMFAVQLCVWAPTQRFFLVYLALPMAGLAVIELLSLAARQAINRITVQGTYIRSRRLFGWYDFLGLYLHFVSGSSLAILRMLLTYVDFAVNFARLDLPVFEGSLQNLDPGHASFMAMLYLDYVYNSPITSVLATNLANAMKIRRMKNEMMEDEQRPETQAMLKQAANERNQRNRWQLLFTLTRNDAMKSYRVQPPPPRNAWDSDGEGSVSSGASERRAREELEERAAMVSKSKKK